MWWDEYMIFLSSTVLKNVWRFIKMQIPADMVVNTIVMAIVAHKLQPSSQRIYHVGSSLRNSMRYIDLKNFLFQYFIEKPWIDEDGNAIKVKKIIVFNNMASFHRHMSIRYLIFLKVHCCKYYKLIKIWEKYRDINYICYIIDILMFFLYSLCIYMYVGISFLFILSFL